jgi:molybdopterin adenylyltransferase
MRIMVVTISDRASRGEYKDLSGPKIVELLCESFPDSTIERFIVADDKHEILKALNRAKDWDFIFTTGGTGISPRDITPEITSEFCDKELPGISEMLRMESYKEKATAVLSRGYSGMKGDTIVVNFPGSLSAAKQCTSLMIPIMKHALKMILGEGHEKEN